MKKKITLKQISKEFEVSISTVSKALKDSHEISNELKEKIKAFADYYHYRPNSLALNLRNQKTKTIGIIIPEIVHHFFTTVISGIEHVANEKGYNVMICMSNESYEKEVLNMDMLANGVVDGIIVSVAKETEEKEEYSHFKDLISNGIPLVMFDRVINEIYCNKVITNDVDGGYLATKHLMNIGCKNIAILTTPDYVTVGDLRKQGYIKALQSRNIPIDDNLIVKVSERYGDIEEQIKKAFDQKNPPDGIFAVNEIYAAVAMKTAKNKGLNVPEDVSVIGFTDGLISQYSTPSLTTVAQHGYAMGEKAVKLLLDELDSQESDIQYKTEIIETDLILRESTKE
ncbi:MAG: LacI family DNA-binding transcriptional regulator [Bacteroidota bacterium]